MRPILLIVKVKVKVKSTFIKRHKNYTISTETKALATLRLATWLTMLDSEAGNGIGLELGLHTMSCNL